MAVASRACEDGGMTGATALFPATCGFGQQGQLWSRTGESLDSEERVEPSKSWDSRNPQILEDLEDL